jgi:membrane protein implicated in regulation of membrane protease activity
MTLTEWAQTLSIATSVVALVVSLYGFARFVRRWRLATKQSHLARPPIRDPHRAED